MRIVNNNSLAYTQADLGIGLSHIPFFPGLCHTQQPLPPVYWSPMIVWFPQRTIVWNLPEALLGLAQHLVTHPVHSAY